MTVDVVNGQNQKVGSLDLRDEVFGGQVKQDLIWMQVRHENASMRSGTHATKSRGMVSGSGRKPWRQKGTGRARVGETRNPLWRKGGTVFGPQPRDYSYHLPLKVAKGALKAALTQKWRDNAVIVVETLEMNEIKTAQAAQLLATLGHARKSLVIDVQLNAAFTMSARNIAGIDLRPSSFVTARDVMDANRVIITRAAVERLQEVLA